MKSKQIFTEKKRKIWTCDFSEKDILKVFLEEESPLLAMVRLQDFSLTWLVSKLFNNQQGNPLNLLPFQSVCLKLLWHKKFPAILMSRGGSKSFLLALYGLLRALLVPGSQVVIVGAVFRQSKVVFNYIEKLYQQSPIIQESLHKFGGPKWGSDQCSLKVGPLSRITALPIGDGSNIRGQRSTNILCDEFASLSEEVFENVISPFASVHSNPEQRARVKAFCSRLQRLGAKPDLVSSILESQGHGNQVVISGTAHYKFNHFFRRYRLYKSLIESGGRKQPIRDALAQKLRDEGKKPEVSPNDIERLSKSWSNYGIFQLPYDGLPEGFLDDEIVENDKLSFTQVRFDMEYRCKFADDSEGFIRRSEIEDATPSTPPLRIELYGDPSAIYVLGLDPARHNDNFGAVVIKIGDGIRVPVYCQAWNRTEYTISVHKIREILRRFNISYIAMDAGGGGSTITEMLCNKDLCKGPGDYPIWQIPEQLEKGTKGLPGPKILDLVNWTSSWIRDNAHGIHADINHHRLQFPSDPDLNDIYYQYMRHFNLDDISEKEKMALESDLFGDENKLREDSEIGVWDHFEEMINEMCAIERRVTPHGTEQFDLPKLSEQPEGLDIRRRDRWSALVLANYAARTYMGHGHKHHFDPGSAGIPEQIVRKSANGRIRAHVKRRGSTFYL